MIFYLKHNEIYYNFYIHDEDTDYRDKLIYIFRYTLENIPHVINSHFLDYENIGLNQLENNLRVFL